MPTKKKRKQIRSTKQTLFTIGETISTKQKELTDLSNQLALSIGLILYRDDQRSGAAVYPIHNINVFDVSGDAAGPVLLT